MSPNFRRPTDVAQADELSGSGAAASRTIAAPFAAQLAQLSLLAANFLKFEVFVAREGA